ncbi:MAG: multicopper oxidase domain-containing protein [Thermoproteota archaeon]|nr:multicopper oxidase domain-containing protein [Thermoproteota archaeon]
MLNKYSLIILTFAVATLLIGAAITPIVNAQLQTLVVPSLKTTTNTTAAANTTAIQAQISSLQKQLYNAQHVDQIKQQSIEAKLLQPIAQSDKAKNCAIDQHTPTTFKTYLTHFACGHVTVLANGTTVRQFTLIADDYNGTGTPIEISTNTPGLGKPLTSYNQTYKPVIFHAWTFNGTVPGPTMRFTQGDHVQIKVINAKDSQFPHSLHMHSMHPGAMDGMSGAAGMIEPGGSLTYDFIAQPAGVYPYHCHMAPVEEHISRGLYGMMIIDPKTPRPQATEMVMMLNSYTYSFQGVNGSGHFTPTLPATMQQMEKNLSAVEFNSDEGNGPDNQFYSVNGMPFGYVGKDSVHLTTGTPYRIYLANMVEFDPVNSFHMHGNMFNYTPSGTLNSSKIYTDIVTLGQGDRGMLEFHYNFPGQFMFHAHINHFSDLGWIGFFLVDNKPGPFFNNG